MRKINKFILAASVFCIANTITYGQTYSIIANDTISMTGIMEDLATLTIQQQNISNNTITLEWQKVSESVPPVWETNVCDNVICYSSLVNGGVMNPVGPGDFGFLMMHVTPHVNFGTAIIRYAVWDAAFPLLKDTLTYILTVNAPTGINNVTDVVEYSLFPNPANEMLHLKSDASSSFKYQISDMAGRIIESGESYLQQLSINTSEYHNGIYYFDIIDGNGKRRNSKIVILH